MPTLAIIGAQWGDEGKGKITDYLAEDSDAVVRFQGGNNAGHTIVIDDKVFKLHMLPSGILRPGKLAIIGNGVVVNMDDMAEEMQQIQDAGLKGKAFGKAVVSMKHANFITTTKGVRSEDYRNLIAYIKKVVEEKSGICLEPEIEMMGFQE